jgi:hypothetical protein
MIRIALKEAVRDDSVGFCRPHCRVEQGWASDESPIWDFPRGKF